MHKLNIIYPAIVRSHKNNFYIRRPWLFNEFTKHYDVDMYSSVDHVEHINEDEFLQLDSNITVKNFFDDTSLSYSITNFFELKTELRHKTDFENDYYFLLYPFRKTSVVFAYMLKDTKLGVRIISDYVDLYPTVSSGKIKNIIKKVTYPLVSCCYPALTSRILQNSFTLYSGDIIYDRENHRRQVSTNAIPPLNRDMSLVDEELGDTIGFVGNASKQKGLDILIDAMEMSTKSLCLDIIGLNSPPDNLTESELQYNIRGRIYDREKFYQHLSDCDILVMPSRGERQGQVQLEAMSVGVVPICSDTGGVYTTINHMYNGILFKEGNVEALAKSIDFIYNNEGIYKEMALNGREYISDKSLEKYVERMATTMKNYYAYESSHN